MITRRQVLGIVPSSVLLAAVRGDEVMYVGGTMKVPEATEGSLETTDPKALRFTSSKEREKTGFHNFTRVWRANE